MAGEKSSDNATTNPQQPVKGGEGRAPGPVAPVIPPGTPAHTNPHPTGNAFAGPNLATAPEQVNPPAHDIDDDTVAPVSTGDVHTEVTGRTATMTEPVGGPVTHPNLDLRTRPLAPEHPDVALKLQRDQRDRDASTPRDKRAQATAQRDSLDAQRRARPATLAPDRGSGHDETDRVSLTDGLLRVPGKLVRVDGPLVIDIQGGALRISTPAGEVRVTAPQDQHDVLDALGVEFRDAEESDEPDGGDARQTA